MPRPAFLTRDQQRVAGWVQAIHHKVAQITNENTNYDMFVSVMSAL